MSLPYTQRVFVWVSNNTCREVCIHLLRKCVSFIVVDTFNSASVRTALHSHFRSMCWPPMETYIHKGRQTGTRTLIILAEMLHRNQEGSSHMRDLTAIEFTSNYHPPRKFLSILYHNHVGDTRKWILRWTKKQSSSIQTQSSARKGGMKYWGTPGLLVPVK